MRILLANLSAVFVSTLLILSVPVHAKKPIFEGSVAVAVLIHNHNDVQRLLDKGKSIPADMPDPRDLVMAEAQRLFSGVEAYSLTEESQLLMLVYLGYGPNIELGLRASSDGYDGKQAVQVILMDGEGNELANIAEGHRSTKKAIQKAVSQLRKGKLKKKVSSLLPNLNNTNWLLAYNPDISVFRPINMAVEIQLINDLQYIEHSLNPATSHYHTDPLHVAHALIELQKPTLFKKFSENVSLSTGVHGAARGVPAIKIVGEQFIRKHLTEMKKAGYSAEQIELARTGSRQAVEAQYPEPKRAPLYPREVVDRTLGVIKMPGIPVWEQETLLTRAIKTGMSTDTINHILNLDWYKNTNLRYEPNLSAETMITLAFKKERLDLIEKLDLNGLDSTQITAAHYALWNNDINTYRALKLLGAEPDQEVIRGSGLAWLPHLARYQKWEALRYLAKNEPDITRKYGEAVLVELINGSSLSGYSNSVKNLEAGILKDTKMTAPMSLRAKYIAKGWSQLSEEEFTQDFRELAAKRSWSAAFRSGNSRLGAFKGDVLHEKITPKHIKTETTLSFLELGIDPNMKLKDGSSLMHWAVRGHQDALIQHLGSIGADPNILDAEGRSPAFYAFPTATQDMTPKDEQTIQVLANIGADFDLKDRQGFAPFDAYVNSVKSYRVDYAQAQYEERRQLAEDERKRQLAEIRAERAAERRRIEQARRDQQRAEELREERETMNAILNGFRQGVEQAVGEYQRDQAREARQHEENMNWARELDGARQQAVHNRRQAEQDFEREQEQLAREMADIRDQLWQRHSNNGGAYAAPSSSSNSATHSQAASGNSSRSNSNLVLDFCPSNAVQSRLSGVRDEKIRAIKEQFKNNPNMKWAEKSHLTGLMNAAEGEYQEAMERERRSCPGYDKPGSGVTVD